MTKYDEMIAEVLEQLAKKIREEMMTVTEACQNLELPVSGEIIVRYIDTEHFKNRS